MTSSTYFKGISVVVDTSWGDTGKGKIVDEAASAVDMVVRFSGGDNAGHTIKNSKGEFKLHLVPSGIFNPKALCIIDSGVVVNPFSLRTEIENLIEAGVKVSPSNLLLSKRAHLIMPWHILRDASREKTRGKRKIGTTGKGIGPAYSDRAAREGLRVDDLIASDFVARFDRELERQNKLIKSLFKGKPLDRSKTLTQLKRVREFLKPYITNTLVVIHQFKKKKKRILGEGAQGALLDIGLGGYPYVSSSYPTLAGFSLSTGIYDVDKVIGVVKAYTTRVGEGPMPTELKNKVGDRLRLEGNEYGATTGRPRRCGWLDLPAIRYGILVSGARSLAITKLDILDSFSEIKVCVGYKIKRKVYKIPPDMDVGTLTSLSPVYKKFAGWKSQTSNIKLFKDLPRNAKRYIQFIGKELEKSVDIISVGAQRGQTIFR